MNDIGGVVFIGEDRWMYATLEPAGMCPVMSEKWGLVKM